MIVKINNVHGGIECFETPNYMISKSKEFHPLICKVTLYSDDGLKIVSRKRPFSFIYKHFTFKTKKVQKILAELNQVNTEETTQEN